MKRASCGLLYGGMNTTKTTNLGRIAEYLFDKYGLRSRLISADNEYDTVGPQIARGIIEPFAIVAVPNPFPVMTKLSLGEWPVVENGNLVMRPTTTEEWKKIGAYLIEGTTTIAELLHQDHIRKARKIGEDLVGKFEEDGITFAKSAMSHYGHVQDFVTLDLIPRFEMLPVRWIWWTGHEYAGEDEATGQMRLGPGVVGKAAVTKVPRKLGNTFHFVAHENIRSDPATHKTTRTMEYRAYFDAHADAYMKTMMWPAGIKLPVAWITEWRNRFPDGYIPLTLTAGVEQFLAFHDEMASKYGEVVTEGMAGSSNVIVIPSAVTTPVPATPAAPAASQTRPPARAYAPPPRRLRTSDRWERPPMQPPIPQPTLEEKLKESIEKVTGQPVEVPPSSLPPDINALPAEPEKEPA